MSANTTRLACYALIASALVLAGLVATVTGDYTRRADAGMVIAKDAFTLLTARTANNEESMFVLNTSTGDLIVYRVAIRGNAGQVQPVGYAALGELFAQAQGNNAGNNRR